MEATQSRAILILGREPPSEKGIELAESFGEVVVIERPVPDPRDQYVVDETRARAEAGQRLAEILERLRADRVLAEGFVGDEDAAAARQDAHELYPDAVVIESDVALDFSSSR
jgi:nicotinamidase-related amidase